MEHRVDAIVAGVGSSGTITGLTRYFKEKSPQTEFILADPEGSILADFINKHILRTDAGSWLVEGIGEDFIPSLADFSLTTKAYTISDRDSFTAVRNLLRREGILAGSSTGTLLAAAIRYCREQTLPKRVVTFACDSGNKYLSKMYNDYWLLDRELVDKQYFGDLRDFISRRYEDNSIIYVHSGDTLKTVYGKFKLYDISQLPVIDGDDVVGFVDESDLFMALYTHNRNWLTPVAEFMSRQLTTIPYTAGRDELAGILNSGLVAIVVDPEGCFEGLVTRMDFINHLKN
jgi:cystathionine beta-synthase